MACFEITNPEKPVSVHKAKDARVWMWSERKEHVMKMIGGEKIVLVKKKDMKSFYHQMEYVGARTEIEKEIRRVPVKVTEEEKNWWHLENVEHEGLGKGEKEDGQGKRESRRRR